MRYTLILTVLLNLLSLMHCFAFAGSQQASGPSQFTFEEAAQFAKHIEKHAAGQGARVFVLARLGSPKDSLPEGIHYTHVGLAVYSAIETPEGETLKGYAVHNLYQDAEDRSRSSLITDYPVDFFLGATELSAGVIIPSRKLQQKLLDAIAASEPQRLHNPAYSIIANPYSTQYQNCTEHLLDLIFAALYANESITQIKANQRAYFHAHQFRVSAFKRFLAPMLSEDIQMGDQSTTIQIATFSTIADFLTQYGLADSVSHFDKASLLNQVAN